MKTVSKKNDNVAQVSLEKCFGWFYDGESISHSSGRYFNVSAFRDKQGEYVLIDQQEIGLLGVIFDKESKDVLVQIKPEPGNAINLYQIAPTVQATKSNYEQVHGGKPTLFLEEFSDIPSSYQSEQGSKFFNKFNDNKVLFRSRLSINESDNRYRYIKLTKLKFFLLKSFFINTDLRSALTTAPWSIYSFSNKTDILFQSIHDEILRNALSKSYYFLRSNYLCRAIEIKEKCYKENNQLLKRIKLSSLKNYHIDQLGISNKNFYLLNFFDVFLPSREIPHWAQPMILSNSIDVHILAFIIINGNALFFINAIKEPGYAKNTSQLTSSFIVDKSSSDSHKIFVKTVIKKSKVICKLRQSDEGGRFYRNITDYYFLNYQDKSHYESNSVNYFSLAEIESMVRKSYFTNEMRTLLSMILGFI